MAYIDSKQKEKGFSHVKRRSMVGEVIWEIRKEKWSCGCGRGRIYGEAMFS
jgi:hypothetical protein